MGGFMKILVAGLALLVGLADANAGFVAASWDSPGIPTQQSFVTLYAVGAIQGPQTFDSFSIPSVVNLSNGTIADKAQIDASVSFLPSTLAIDLTRLERRDRDTYTNVQGAFVFSVSESMSTVASGHLSLLPPGLPTENGLWARLFDYTTQEFLFQSSQYDYGFDKTYELGGLVGNRGASFSGSLANTLEVGHVYRFDYLLQSGNNGAGDFGSSALGAFSLTTVAAVPEPETYAMLLAGLGVMGAVARRRKAKQA
jgi:hypothetical protein